MAWAAIFLRIAAWTDFDDTLTTQEPDDLPDVHLGRSQASSREIM